MTVPHGTPRGLVVWFHGFNGAAGSYRDGFRAPLAAALTDAGYVVAGTAAEGNAWGNARSVQDYADLVRRLQQRYRTTRTFFVGESMGGAAMVNLAATHRVGDLRGIVAVEPVVALAGLAREQRFRRSLDAAYDGAVPPTTRFAEVTTPMLLFLSPQDTVVPEQDNGDLLTGEKVACTGEHYDASCYQPVRVLDWLSRR